jgi:hypothetical protein
LVNFDGQPAEANNVIGLQSIPAGEGLAVDQSPVDRLQIFNKELTALPG